MTYDTTHQDAFITTASDMTKLVIPERRKGLERMMAAGLRRTRPRQILADMLLNGPYRHVKADQIHAEITQKGKKVSLATVYNTLHEFTRVGLLQEVGIKSAGGIFDTNPEPHYHFFDERSQELIDIPEENLSVLMPSFPKDRRLVGVEVTIRLA